MRLRTSAAMAVLLSVTVSAVIATPWPAWAVQTGGATADVMPPEGLPKAIPASTASLAMQIAKKLAAHRATYKLVLDSSRADVVSAGGTMSYEMMDACDGWAVQQRLDLTITNRDGQDIQQVSDYATWESKDGTRLRFRTRETTDTAVTSVVSGEATLQRPGGPGEVTYVEPKPKTVPLPAGTLFPTMHTATIIAAAEQGKKFLALPLFDGTSPGGPQYTSVVVTGWHGPEPFRVPELAKLPSGGVHVAFFDLSDRAEQPDYEVGMRYWENGVADGLRMDFGQFVMKGALDNFRLLPQPHNC